MQNSLYNLSVMPNTIKIASINRNIEMLIIRKIDLLMATFCLIVFPFVIYAQPSQVPDANWTTVDHFKYCGSGECETFKNVQLSTNSITVGQDITVINRDTGDAIETFNVKSIRYGRQVKMCWIGNSDGMVSENYITVKGCKR